MNTDSDGYPAPRRKSDYTKSDYTKSDYTYCLIDRREAIWS